MKTTIVTKLAVGVTVASALAAASANASLSLTMANYGVGWSDPSAVPPSSADMNGYIVTMVGLYNTHADGYSTTITIAGTNDGGTSSKDQFTAYVDKGSLVPGTLSSGSVSGFTGNNVSVPQGSSGSGPNSYTIDLGAGGYTYLIAGWDGPQGADQLYFVGGLTGQITIDNSELPSSFQKGLSNYWLGTASTTSVPEPSTVVAGALLLLPLGVSAIRVLRKSRQA